MFNLNRWCQLALQNDCNYPNGFDNLTNDIDKSAIFYLSEARRVEGSC